ncbi:hypothetical protein ACLB1Q_09310 [Escherichia coli]
MVGCVDIQRKLRGVGGNCGQTRVTAMARAGAGWGVAAPKRWSL